ncbi:hypothetical protein FA13DRAFT_1640449 [Coprinellus micaceus]|uniref:Uncharacterized protein n=1 Tax=Coprinellus micaceus TaxID=71717 RepID=A0A4Y7SMM2_COPMI|nr:hypothetical protein FA13DRAFT_1640449 [Coprinellus micaceus]
MLCCLLSKNGVFFTRHVIECARAASVTWANDVLFIQLGFITLDNASNCNTMMQRLEQLLKALKIDFLVDENRIRCAFITQLQDDLAADPGWDVMDDLANALRSSGQRLDDLSSVIRKGWDDELWTPEEVPDHAVLNDMDVRWSSTFLMIDRILELYPAIEVMAEQDKHEWLRPYLLTAEQLRRLDKIRNFLEIPHSIQEGVSADKTPTLPVALPAYEQLLTVLRVFKSAEPEIAHGVQAAIDKLNEYFQKTRSARVYEIAMIVNPTIKLEWLKKNWSESEVESAKETMITAVSRFLHGVRLSEG